MSKNIFFGPNQPCLLIAEIGINHNGSPKLAKEMIKIAAEVGVDVVKFQMRHLDDLYVQDVLENIENQDLALQQSIDFVKKTQLNFTDFEDLASYAKQLSVIFACTPWDLKSVDFLEKLEVPFYKMASADLSNYDLIDKILTTNKPLILSTGMALDEEIDKTYHYLLEKGADFALLHCNSTYPADFKDINLRYMSKMMQKYDVPIGYSGHERGISVSQAACALGAKVIERHFTLDRSMKGPDQKASLEPDELKKLVQGIKKIELALGSSDKELTQGVVMNREPLGKSLFATRQIKPGQEIKKDMLEIKSPGKGVPPFYLDQLVGSKAKRKINSGEYFLGSDLNLGTSDEFTGSLQAEWAVPARFHDLNEMWQIFKPDFVELHLSYKDVLEPKFPNSLPDNFRFKVHVPDHWKNGFILNLASLDNRERKRSIDCVKKTFKVVEQFVSKFNLEPGQIDCIVHGGGQTSSAPNTDQKIILKKHQYLKQSLLKLKSGYSQFNLLPENMPPLPWLLGGQYFYNVFTNQNDIINFCKKNDFQICLDISHAYLYSQYSTADFFEYVSALLPFTKHLHLADAKGTDGEGLVIGEGDIEFDRLRKVIKTNSSKFSILAEIWQGHKFEAKGFHKSLIALQDMGY